MEGSIDVSVAVRETIKALEDADGRITPEAVIEAARDEGSPLHQQFEWDDSKAAHGYRLEQARTLIRSVKLLVTIEDRVISTVHYVRDPRADAGEQGYVSVTQLRSEPEHARAMLRVEFSRAAACLHRAEDLADALGLRKDVAVAARRVEAVRKKLERQQPAAAH